MTLLCQNWCNNDIAVFSGAEMGSKLKYLAIILAAIYELKIVKIPKNKWGLHQDKNICEIIVSTGSTLMTSLAGSVRTTTWL